MLESGEEIGGLGWVDGDSPRAACGKGDAVADVVDSCGDPTGKALPRQSREAVINSIELFTDDPVGLEMPIRLCGGPAGLA